MAKAQTQTEQQTNEQSTRILVKLNPQLMPHAFTQLQSLEAALNTEFKSKNIQVAMIAGIAGPVETQLVTGKASDNVMKQIAGKTIQLLAAGAL